MDGAYVGILASDGGGTGMAPAGGRNGSWVFVLDPAVLDSEVGLNVGEKVGNLLKEESALPPSASEMEGDGLVMTMAGASASVSPASFPPCS